MRGRVGGHERDAGTAGVVLPEVAGEFVREGFNVKEIRRAPNAIVGLTLMDTEEPLGTKIFGRERLEMRHCRLVSRIYVEVVGKVSDESSKKLEFLVRRRLLLSLFQRL